MPRRPKDIGTRCETAVVRYLQANGWPSAERRVLRPPLTLGSLCTGAAALAHLIARIETAA